MTAGIRELKDNLSHYLRQVEKGKTVSVTLHGRVVAELAPPRQPARRRQLLTRYEELVAKGVIRPPLETGDPLGGDDWPDLRLSSGSWLQELDEVRKDYDE